MGIYREHAVWLQPFGNAYGVPAQFGIQGVPQSADNGGLLQFNVGTLSRFGSFDSLPSNKYGTTPQFTDDLTLTYGANTIRIGYEQQRIIYPFEQPPQSRGLFANSGMYTSMVGQTDGSTAVAQMLLLPTATSNIAGANTVSLSTLQEHSLIRNFAGAYIRNSWKITHDLTLNVGLRYDFYSFPHDCLGEIANFVPGLNLDGGTYYVTSQIAGQLTPNFTNGLAAESIAVK